MEKLARIYINEIVARYGVPVSIISNHDCRLASHFWQTLQNALGTRLDMSTTYHPQTECQSERTRICFELVLWILVAVGILTFHWLSFLIITLIGPEIIQETTEKIMQIKERLKTAKSRQKSYADKRRKPLEFNVGDRVLLKISSWKGVVRFWKEGKVGTTELRCIHDTFHVSKLKKCLAESDVLKCFRGIEIDENMRFIEEPIEIVNREVKKLKRRRIPLVKVRWNSRQGAEFTWEREDQFKAKF
ncbi:putative reverse transcriptase domain-containing protein [Tanacetum coccineum]